VLNTYGGVTSSDTRDVEPHGLVKGNTISSPTVFVGFGPDWRTVVEAYGDAETRELPRNSRGTAGCLLLETAGMRTKRPSVIPMPPRFPVSFKKQPPNNHFQNKATVLHKSPTRFGGNLSGLAIDSVCKFLPYEWSKSRDLLDAFRVLGTAQQGSNSLLTGNGSYKWSDAYLRTTNGDPQIIDNGSLSIQPIPAPNNDCLLY